MLLVCYINYRKKKKWQSRGASNIPKRRESKSRIRKREREREREREQREGLNGVKGSKRE